MTDRPTTTDVLYGLDDRPPLGEAIVLAAQHVLTMFGSTVAVPLLLGDQMGMNRQEVAVLISSVMLCSGVATLIQSTWGSRLPIIQGVSFSFLAAFGAIIAKVRAPLSEQGLEGDGVLCMRYLAGAVMCGAMVEVLVGFSGLMGVVRRMLSPVVVGPVIMLIGLALYQAGAPVAATHWPTSILTMTLVILFSLVLARRSRLFRLFPLLLAILIACTVCGVLSWVGVYDGPVYEQEVLQKPAHPAYLDFSAVGASQWIRVQHAVFPWGTPKFATAFVVAVLAGYLASMIESFGDYHACSHMAGAGDPSPAQISRGIGCEGIGCALTGLFGGFSSTSYSENIGLVGLTRVGSRYVVQIAAVMLIVLGCLGKFGGMAAAIPKPVVGGLYCTLFGLISAVGVRQLAKANLDSDRNLLIAGFALFMGLSVPAYFESATGQEALQSLAEWNTGLKDIVEAIGKTGMAVAAILGLLLDNLVPGTARERGLES